MTGYTGVKWWDDQGGFFGSRYMVGDDSVEGYLPNTPETLEERTLREVDGIIRLLELTSESIILDVPCGYGRHSIELTKRGFRRVTGLDINTLHLEHARKKGCCDFLHGDMRDLAARQDLHAQYDVVINMFYSFGFFDSEEDNQRVMQGFYEVLKKQGVLLLHTDVSSEILLHGRSYRFSERRNLKNGGVLHIEEQYDPCTKRIHGSWTIDDLQGNGHQLIPYSVRIYSAEEFRNLAHGSGFSHVEFYGSFCGEPFTSESNEMIVVARKIRRDFESL